MAEDDKKKRNKKKKNRKKKTRLTPEMKALKKDLKGAEKVSDSLGLLEETPNISTEAYEKIAAEIAGRGTDPTPLQSQVLQILGEQMANKQGSTEEEKEILSILRESRDGAGVRSAQTNEALDQLNKLYLESGKEDARLTSVLSQMEDGLLGFNDRELTALKERTLREFEGRKQAATRVLNDSLARSGATGGAALQARKQLERDGLRAEAQANQDLIIAQADEQQERRKEFADMVRGVQTDKFDRQSKSLGDYTAALADNEAIERDEKVKADALLTKGLLDVSDRTEVRGDNATANYINTALGVSDSMTTERDKKDALGIELQTLIKEIELANAGKVGNDLASRLAAITGVLGVGVAEKTADAQLKAIENQGKSSGSNSGGNSSTSSFVSSIDRLIENIV